MKTFTVEFLCFPGLEVHCSLCDALLKEKREEIIVPVVYYGERYEGPICSECYKDLPDRINASRLPSFGG